VTDHSKQASVVSRDPSLSVYSRLRHKLARGLAAINPAKRREKALWLTRDGVEFLRAAGIGSGDTVVDFGCGAGAYSIPAALLVGNDGLVVSVDVRAPALKRLMRTASARGLGNIRAVQHLAEMEFLLDGRPCRAVLLYDVLHFMDTDTRKGLYRAFHETLGPDGFLSVFPKHLRGDSPSRYFRDMTIENVSREIEETGFLLCGRLNAGLWHNPDRERGTVLTFRKANGETAGSVATSAANEETE
jgi:predicted methyltransferase